MKYKLPSVIGFASDHAGYDLKEKRTKHTEWRKLIGHSPTIVGKLSLYRVNAGECSAFSFFEANNCVFCW